MRNYWGIHIGEAGEFVEFAKKGDYIAIGWNELGNLNWLIKGHPSELKTRLSKIYKKVYRSKISGNAIGQIMRFIREIKKDDIVLLPNPITRTVLIGKVVGNYGFEKSKDGCRYRNRKKVKWLKEVERDKLSQPLKKSLSSMLTIFSISGYDKEISNLIAGKPSHKISFPARKEEESIVGETINFRGLIFAPINEQGVVFLFSKISKDLGIEIEEIKQGFPDAIGRVKISRGYAKRSIEFEFKSSNYDHLPKKCDILICWEDDWKDCPRDIHVIELKNTIKKLKDSE